MENTLVSPSSCPCLVQKMNRTGSWLSRGRVVVWAWLLAVGFCLFPSNSPAWGETATENSKIVAAGFGYQIGPVSLIAVKVYDAESGSVLSDEVYELAVKEHDGGGATHGPRIFAGGVGVGATDMSNFMLRVYDATTGAFQWEGRLNLVQADLKAGLPVSARLMPRPATVTKTRAVEPSTEQPVFHLRALDATTGLPIWEDEFTAARTRVPRVQPIVGQPIQPAGISSENSHSFDFRIRMYDADGKGVLWEDVLSQVEPDEGVTESSGDRAAMLPAWPHQSHDEEIPAESI